MSKLLLHELILTFTNLRSKKTIQIYTLNDEIYVYKLNDYRTSNTVELFHKDQKNNKLLIFDIDTYDDFYRIVRNNLMTNKLINTLEKEIILANI